MGKEFPEAELVKRTFILRQMDLPPNVAMTKRSLLRWFALSFGLISEKESRDTILDVLDALFYFQQGKGVNPTTEQLLSHLQGKKKPISEKLLRYHLKRLIDLGFLQKNKLRHGFAHSPYAEKGDLKAGFNYAITAKVQNSLNDIETVLEKLSESYKK